MMHRRWRPRPLRGFSLVEVMIAMVILLVGVLGLVVQFPAGLRLLVTSGDSLRELTIMERELERAEATPFSELQLGTTTWMDGPFKVQRTIQQGPTANTVVVVVRTKAPAARVPRRMASVVAASR